MKRQHLMITIFLLFMCLPFFNATSSETKMPENISLKLKGAKQKAVPFSHETHAQKLKIDCASCHHRDKIPTQPQACTSCHPAAKGKSDVLQAKDAFHKRCVTCHKKSTATNVPAPSKCAECHKN